MGYRLLLDEHVEREVIERLADLGHDDYRAAVYFGDATLTPPR